MSDTGVDAATPPVLEPSSYLLMLAGMAAMGFVARRSTVK
ncbi:PEP-CTERM sorting domain-containing protein [Aquincola tertiaricarbonis]